MKLLHKCPPNDSHSEWSKKHASVVCEVKYLWSQPESLSGTLYPTAIKRCWSGSPLGQLEPETSLLQVAGSWHRWRARDIELAKGFLKSPCKLKNLGTYSKYSGLSVSASLVVSILIFQFGQNPPLLYRISRIINSGNTEPLHKAQ